MKLSDIASSIAKAGIGLPVSTLAFPQKAQAKEYTPVYKQGSQTSSQLSTQPSANHYSTNDTTTFAEQAGMETGDENSSELKGLQDEQRDYESPYASTDQDLNTTVKHTFGKSEDSQIRDSARNMFIQDMAKAAVDYDKTADNKPLEYDEKGHVKPRNDYERAEMEAAERAVEYQMLAPHVNRGVNGEWDWSSVGIADDDIAGQEGTRWVLMHPNSTNNSQSWADFQLLGDNYGYRPSDNAIEGSFLDSRDLDRYNKTDEAWRMAFEDERLDPYLQNLETAERWQDDEGNFDVEKYLADPGFDPRDFGSMSDEDILLAYGTSASQIDDLNKRFAYDYGLPIYISNNNNSDESMFLDTDDENLSNWFIDNVGFDDERAWLTKLSADPNSVYKNLNDQAIARVAQAAYNRDEDLPFTDAELAGLVNLGGNATYHQKVNDGNTNFEELPEGYRPFDMDIDFLYKNLDARGLPKKDYTGSALHQAGYGSWRSKEK